MNMKVLEYKLQFLSPAFLGNAEQSAQWRTPPIKALLRQWWRVAYAADRVFAVNLADMRREEGLLFGNAWLEDNFGKSRVRLRLDRWDMGKLRKQDWQPLASVAHPEVPRGVGSDLYLGYGLVTLPRGAHQPTLKANAAIQAGESATLSLAVPEADAPLIERGLWLMDRYGTLGGRSRNGWGSFSLLPLPPGEASPERSRGGWGDGNLPLRSCQDCMELDWPHAIGADEQNQPLIWQTTQAFGDWKSVMQRLAQIKIGLRTQAQFEFGLDAVAGDQAHNQNIVHGRPQNRHWLSYPVTHHDVRAWKRENLRLPNTLRFKIRRTDKQQFVGVIFYVPHKPPAQFQPNAQTLQQVWSQVHGFLNAPAQQLTRIPE
jgi:CRISPR-associated protein Cmr1